jgi:hypothetical protein
VPGFRAERPVTVNMGEWSLPSARFEVVLFDAERWGVQAHLERWLLDRALTREFHAWYWEGVRERLRFLGVDW